MNFIGKALLLILIGAGTFATLFGIGWCTNYISVHWPLIQSTILSIIVCGLVGCAVLGFKK